MTPQRAAIPPLQPGPRQGAALVVALICLLLVSMLSAVLIRTALAQRDQLQRDAWQLQAEWLAQAGLERALVRLGSDPAYTGETWQTAAGDGKPIGRVDITVAAADDGAGGRLLKLSVNVPDDPVNRAHVEREVLLPDSSINGEEPGVGQQAARRPRGREQAS
ncbi:MAG: hypothetical protein JNG89_07075 [Planctomycetaceae bacterium]|nr:hypothetical protein [Planctomycetaceae bacterium]